jgi:hypothetical protein
MWTSDWIDCRAILDGIHGVKTAWIRAAVLARSIIAVQNLKNIRNR